MPEQAQPRRFQRFHRVRKHRVTRWAVALLLLFISYRVFAVYTFRQGCATPRGVRIVTAQTIPSPSPPGSHLTILTYNIEGHAALVRNNHLEQIAEVIRSSRADVVGLEEVHRHTWQSRFRDQALELARMTGMSVAFAPSFTVFGGDFGNAILTRGVMRRASVIDLPSIGEPRAMLIADIEIDGRLLRFDVAHLAAWGGLNSRIRMKQVDCLVSLVRAQKGDFVLVGDFNSGPATPEILHARAAPELHFLNALDAPTHRILNETIDYIIASPSIHEVNARVLQSGPSDHWPVVAEVEWAGASK